MKEGQVGFRHFVCVLTLVLKNNKFTFDGNHYLQINGTAMGTKMAPSYANIFIMFGLLNTTEIQSRLFKTLFYPENI
jgi:hypothetical protein